MAEISYCSWETGTRLVIGHNSSHQWRKIQDATTSFKSSWTNHRNASSRLMQKSFNELFFLWRVHAINSSRKKKFVEILLPFFCIKRLEALWWFVHEDFNVVLHLEFSFIDEMNCEQWRVGFQFLSYNSLSQLFCRFFEKKFSLVKSVLVVPLFWPCIVVLK